MRFGYVLCIMFVDACYIHGIVIAIYLINPSSKASGDLIRLPKSSISNSKVKQIVEPLRRSRYFALGSKTASSCAGCSLQLSKAWAMAPRFWSLAQMAGLMREGRGGGRARDGYLADGGCSLDVCAPCGMSALRSSCGSSYGMR